MQFVDLHVITLFFVFADLSPSSLTRAHLPKRAHPPPVAAVDHNDLAALVTEKMREAMAGIRDELRGELKGTEKVLLAAINCREPFAIACSTSVPPSDVPVMEETVVATAPSVLAPLLATEPVCPSGDEPAPMEDLQPSAPTEHIPGGGGERGNGKLQDTTREVHAMYANPRPPDCMLTDGSLVA